MANKNILEYILKALDEGLPVEQINAALSDQGWGSTEIIESLLEAQQAMQKHVVAPATPSVPPKKSRINIEFKNLSASQILLYLGGLIVVLAGIIYIGINWSQWGAVAHIFAILFPMLICYGAGVSMFFGTERQKQGKVFLIVGSLLFPFFLSVLFKEAAIFDKPFNDSFNLTVSFFSLVLYLVSNYFFRFPFWTLLYQGAGLSVYYFFLKFLGIEGFSSKPAMAWLLLIPGTAYVLLSLFYKKDGKEEEGDHSYFLGALVVILSVLRLFFETLDPSKGGLAWLLLISGAAYFIIGIIFEKINAKKYCRTVYFIGALTVFFSLMRLASDGTLLKFFIGGGLSDDLDHILWSEAVIGIIFLLFAVILEKLKSVKLELAAGYKRFFDLVGPLLVLGAIYYLGLNGHKPIYETLLLFTSLGFIFGSIPKQARQYLYIGTMFLIIYIFSIGGEYFKNEVGWPITLFVAGLASMGISIIMEKIRRKYFTMAKTEKIIPKQIIR